MGALLLVLAVLLLVGLTDGQVVVLAGRVLAWAWSVHPLAMTALYAGVVCAVVAVFLFGRVRRADLPPPVLTVRDPRSVVPPPDRDPPAAIPAGLWVDQRDPVMARVVSLDTRRAA